MIGRVIFWSCLLYAAYYWQAHIKTGPMYESDKMLTGKTVILTGGNAGIGKFTAMEIAKRDARLIIASRNVKKSEKAKQEIVEATGNKNIRVMELDLEKYDSVEKFAKDILSTEEHIDFLVNNAGAVGVRGYNAQGHGRILAINHLGHFLLTNLLLDKMKEQSGSRPVRIINVSSEAYKIGKLDFDNLHEDPEGFWGVMKYYGNSKLANIYFTSELQKRVEGFDISTWSLHPGAIKSEIGAGWDQYWYSPIFKMIAVPFLRDTIYGAQTIMMAMLDDGLLRHKGAYLLDCHVGELYDHATDEEVGKKLWRVSEELVGMK